MKRKKLYRIKKSRSSKGPYKDENERKIVYEKFRLSTDEKARIEEAVKKYGYSSKSEFFRFLISQFFEEKGESPL